MPWHVHVHMLTKMHSLNLTCRRVLYIYCRHLIHDMADPSPILQTEKIDHTNISKVESDAHPDFGGDSRLPPPPTLSPEEEKKLWRKIDFRLMPILSLMYLFSFLDRGKKNYLIILSYYWGLMAVGNIGRELRSSMSEQFTSLIREC